MSPLIYEEGWFLLHSVLLGFGVTFVYDCLRICRRVIPHHTFWISLEDLFYWIFVSISIFYLLYRENNGAFRWFSILGAGIGMILFQKTVGRIFVRYCSAMLLWIRKKTEALIRWFLRPLVWVREKASLQMIRGKRKLTQILRILKKRLTVRARVARIILAGHWKKKRRGKKDGKEKNRFQT
ncbi:MAG: spore cortex biosynthesis protein YabQ [Lachnospiraceae bacterium]|nr:spore cortex biosynthesis protein YabQ [Lachnospiraceae bacterium]